MHKDSTQSSGKLPHLQHADAPLLVLQLLRGPLVRALSLLARRPFLVQLLQAQERRQGLQTPTSARGTSLWQGQRRSQRSARGAAGSLQHRIASAFSKGCPLFRDLLASQHCKPNSCLVTLLSHRKSPKSNAPAPGLPAPPPPPPRGGPWRQRTPPAAGSVAARPRPARAQAGGRSVRERARLEAESGAAGGCCFCLYADLNSALSKQKRSDWAQALCQLSRSASPAPTHPPIASISEALTAPASPCPTAS